MPGEASPARRRRHPSPSAAPLISAALLLGSVLGSACAAPVRPGTTAGTEERLTLATSDSEVWTWRLTLEGRAQNGTRLQACTLEVGGHGQPATVAGDRFEGQIHLRSGLNPISATCRADRGRTLRSSVVRLRAMLPDEPAAEVELTRAGQQLTLDGSRSRPSPGSRARITKYEWWLRSGTPGAAQRSALGAGPRLAAALPAADGTYVYELVVTDAEDRTGVGRVALSV